MKDLADAYNQGQFSTIESPLPTFQGGTEEMWFTHLMRQGYKQLPLFGITPLDGLAVWSMPLGRDHDWPYMVEIEIDAARCVFMKKWYDVTHFINNHCLGMSIGAINQLQIMVGEHMGPDYD